MPFVRLIGIVPIGIGLTVLFTVWTQSDLKLPVFFRLFASFIALGFLIVGSAFAFSKTPDPERLRSMLSKIKQPQQGVDPIQVTSAQPPSTGYQCSSCGATLEGGAEVSPHGDVKCDHCGKWFNIHQTN